MSVIAKSPRYFFDIHLMPNCTDWDAQPSDERRAMNAVMSANQMADWVFSYWQQHGDQNKLYDSTKPGEYRTKLVERECQNFALLRDIAECHKHFCIHRNGRQLSSVGQVKVEDI